MKFSIIIPCYDPDNKRPDTIQKCLLSIVKNSYDYVLIPILNVTGFPRAVNAGLKRAEKVNSQFIIILNDDVEIKDPYWLDKLAQPNVISSWRLHPFYLTQEIVPDGACWCMPRNIFNEIGYLDEQFSKGYGFEDSDYWYRAKEKNILFYNAKVKLKHIEREAFKMYYPNGKDDEMLKYNRELFLKKWQLKYPSLLQASDLWD